MSRQKGSGLELCSREQLIDAFENVSHSGPETGQWGEMVSGLSMRDETCIEFEPGEYVSELSFLDGSVDLATLDTDQLGEAL